jgi:hypothetical protein
MDALRDTYRDLSHQQLQDKAYELGVNYERNAHSCSQSTVAALHDILDFDDIMVKIATSSCAGAALQATGTCGPLVGGMIVLDYYFGRPIQNLSDISVRPSVGVAKLLYERYIEEYGSILCPDIQALLFGRVYHFDDPEEGKQFVEAGGQTDPTKCANIVGNAARWVIEILIEKGIII